MSEVPLYFLAMVIAVTTVALFCALAFLATKLRQRFRHLDSQFARLSAQIHAETSGHVVAKMDEKTEELENAIALSQLGFRFPLFLGGWCIDPFLGKFFVQYLIEESPRTILELGSGSSTLLIARCLELLNRDDCEHIAVDHEARFLELTRRNLDLNHLAHRVTFWHCPLQETGEEKTLWYGGLTERLASKKIDLLFVDGPPAALQKDSRLPALPMLMRFLSDRCIVILDDAARGEEQAIARTWAEADPRFSLELAWQGHGMAVLRRSGAASAQ